MLLVLSTHTHTTTIIKLKQEDSLNLRVTRIFSAKSSLEATHTDLCFASSATSSFSLALFRSPDHYGRQCWLPNNIYFPPTSFLLGSKFHLGQQYV